MTKQQWDDYCIGYIKKERNLIDIYWATSNKFIANALMRLEDSGKIVITPLSFPASKVKISGE